MARAERTLRWSVLALVGLLFSSARLYASTASPSSDDIFTVLGWVVVVLVAARLGSAIERIGQPAVVGELLAGIVLSGLGLLGITWLEPMRQSVIMKFLAEIGAILLLFQIGMESNLAQMRRVGFRATLVGTVGIVLPFFGGYLVGQLLFPDMTTNAHIFLGATLTATSVGITMRVLRDVGASSSREAGIILGAAVIDDVLGVIILAVVQGLALSGTIEASQVIRIIAKSVAFFLCAIVLGSKLAPLLTRFFARISTSASMKLIVPLSFGLMLAYLAHAVGLAPIIGAFAAGLILDRVHFAAFEAPTVITELERDIIPIALAELQQRLVGLTQHYRLLHVEELVEPLVYFFVPIFFVMTGFQIDLSTFRSIDVLISGLVITAVAVVGKLVVGFVSGKVRRWIVAWGMVPRGEVGLIFASVGLSVGVVTAEEYSAVMLMVLLTSLITPIILAWLLRRAPATAP